MVTEILLSKKIFCDACNWVFSGILRGFFSENKKFFFVKCPNCDHLQKISIQEYSLVKSVE